jgi:hypothetical protein
MNHHSSLVSSHSSDIDQHSSLMNQHSGLKNLVEVQDKKHIHGSSVNSSSKSSMWGKSDASAHL